MEDEYKRSGMMTRDEWMAWLKESWDEAQKLAARHGGELKPMSDVKEFARAFGAKEWVGLTDDEVSEIIGKEIGFNSCFGPEESFARAIEAKLREKNT